MRTISKTLLNLLAVACVALALALASLLALAYAQSLGVLTTWPAAALLLTTPTPTPTETPSPTATSTPTETPSPTATSTPTETPSPTASPTSTDTPSPTHTSSPTLMPLPTSTPTATDTPSPTATFTPTPTSPPTPDGSQRSARVPILMYHYISDPPADADRYRLDLSVSPADFEAQLAWLAAEGYHTITLYDLYNHLVAGYPLPDKPIILTFDDGYTDAYTFATPLLQKYAFVGVFFVLVGPADRGGDGLYLSWEQITAMSTAGMDIELHAREHYDLRNRSNEFLVYQILGGKQSIEAHVGWPVHWFAYPSGRYDAAVIRVLKSADFWGAVTTQWASTHTTNNLFELPRLRIHGGETLHSFAQKVAGNSP